MYVVVLGFHYIEVGFITLKPISAHNKMKLLTVQITQHLCIIIKLNLICISSCECRLGGHQHVRLSLET